LTQIFRGLRDRESGRARTPCSIRRLRSPILLLLVAAAVIVNAATPPRHVRYELVGEDARPIEALLQSAVDDVNRSLSMSLGEGFSGALETIAGYKDFVLRLSDFRTDIRSRGISALILQPGYSTAPLSALGRLAEAVIRDQASVTENLQLARNASQRGDTREMWTGLLLAQSYLESFNFSISRFGSAVSDLPPFIDTTSLTARSRDLSQAVDRYASMIGALERGTNQTVLLTLRVDRQVVLLGEDMVAEGYLRAGSQGLPGAEILVSNGSAVLARNVTDPQGFYRMRIYIPTIFPTGELSLKASLVLGHVRIESNTSAVRVAKQPTSLTLLSSRAICRTDEAVTLSGLLTDYLGRAIPQKEVVIYSGEDPTSSIITGSLGNFSLNTSFPMDGVFPLRAFFPGNGLYEACTSPWVNVTVTRNLTLNLTETHISLTTNRTSLWPGEGILFRGLLSAGVRPLSNQPIKVHFMGHILHLETGEGGLYRTAFSVPSDARPGEYPAQADYDPPSQTNLTPAISKVVAVTVKTLHGPAGAQTSLELIARPVLAKSGQYVRFSGLLQLINRTPLTKQIVDINFLQSTKTAQTLPDGSFSCQWRIPPGTNSGTYAAQAWFYPVPGSNLSSSASNPAYVTVLGGNRTRTLLDLAASVGSVDPGGQVTVFGTLRDEWGTGLSGQKVLILSPNIAEKIPVQTGDRGDYEFVFSPSLPGNVSIRSSFPGNDILLPSTSPLVVIHVRGKVGAERLGTKIILTAPQRVKIGETLAVSGSLRDSMGNGLGSREILLLWDDLVAWRTTTRPDGFFSLSTEIPSDSPGNHTLQALFESGNEQYLSARGEKLTVEVWAPGRISGEVMMGLVAVGIILLGLALARRLGSRREPTTLEEPVQETGGESRIPSADGASASGRIPHPPEALVPPAQQTVLSSYSRLVRLVSGMLAMDLTNKTHTEILSLLLSTGLIGGLERAAGKITEIYEKAAFSGEALSHNEEDEFSESLRLFLSSLGQRGFQNG